MKKNRINIKEALKILKREGYYLEQRGNVYIDQWFFFGELREEILTEREVIKKAKIYTSENKKNTVVNRKVKEDQRLSRAKLKEILNNEDYDKLSTKNDVYYANRWDYD